MAMRGKTFGLLLAVAAAVFLCAGSLQAQDRIWSGILFGTNHPSPALPPPIEQLTPKLRGLFGFDYYQLLGQSTQIIREDKESWLVPSREFFLKVDNFKPAKKGYRMKLTLFQDNRQVMQAVVKLRDGPLLIRGPSWGNGTVIIMLAAK